jgi:predicted amidohydrolase YtcJ
MIEPPPEWFTVRADLPSLWATDVRVSAEGVEQMARLWAAPLTHPAVRYLWASFLSNEAHVREQLPHVRWERLTPWQLIQFLHVGMGVARGSDMSVRPPSPPAAEH